MVALGHEGGTPSPWPLTRRFRGTAVSTGESGAVQPPRAGRRAALTSQAPGAALGHCLSGCSCLSSASLSSASLSHTRRGRCPRGGEAATHRLQAKLSGLTWPYPPGSVASPLQGSWPWHRGCRRGSARLGLCPGRRGGQWEGHKQALEWEPMPPLTQPATLRSCSLRRSR